MRRFIADYTVTYSATQTIRVDTESLDDVARIIRTASERLPAPHWTAKGSTDVMIHMLAPDTR